MDVLEPAALKDARGLLECVVSMLTGLIRPSRSLDEHDSDYAYVYDHVDVHVQVHVHVHDSLPFVGILPARRREGGVRGRGSLECGACLAKTAR